MTQHPDLWTYLAVSLQVAFWVADIILMALHKETVSKMIGKWERGHLLRYSTTVALGIFLIIHLVVFP